MSRFHNTEEGPKPCKAKPGNCPRGGEHFDSEVEAQQAYESKMELSHGTSVLKRSSKEAKDLKPDDLEKSREELLEHANSSKEGLAEVQECIDQRTALTQQMFKKLDEVSPYNKSTKVSLSPSNFRALKARYNEYRDRTAHFVEAEQASQYLESNVEDYKHSSVGQAQSIGDDDAQGSDWQYARFNRLGGSDIAALVEYQFQEDDAPAWTERNYRRLVRSKTVPPTPESVQKSMEESSGGSGALYRGTVWESRIRESFAKDNPDLTVWDATGQYQHPDADRDYQVVNVDGVISDDGKTPSGILEIKTGGSPSYWDNGVPVGYRVQSLYYLNATGLDRAHIRVCLNDSETRDYVLHRDDEIVPGSGVNMETYIQKTAGPWFNKIRANRA